MAWWRYYTPKPAREVKGGIKAQSKRGAFATSWWGQRWIKVLESFDIGERLNRGRTYARKGQVMDIEIEKGAVRATVQGSRSRPYEVEVRFRPLSRAQWYPNRQGTCRTGLSTLAKLLAGEMPEDIEEVFAQRQVVPLPPPDCETWRPIAPVPIGPTRANIRPRFFTSWGRNSTGTPFCFLNCGVSPGKNSLTLLGYGPAAAAALPVTGPDRAFGTRPRGAAPGTLIFLGRGGIPGRPVGRGSHP